MEEKNSLGVGTRVFCWLVGTGSWIGAWYIIQWLGIADTWANAGKLVLLWIAVSLAFAGWRATGE